MKKVLSIIVCMFILATMVFTGGVLATDYTTSFSNWSPTTLTITNVADGVSFNSTNIWSVAAGTGTSIQPTVEFKFKSIGFVSGETNHFGVSFSGNECGKGLYVRITGGGGETNMDSCLVQVFTIDNATVLHQQWVTGSVYDPNDQLSITYNKTTKKVSVNGTQLDFTVDTTENPTTDITSDYINYNFIVGNINILMKKINNTYYYSPEGVTPETTLNFEHLRSNIWDIQSINPVINDGKILLEEGAGIISRLVYTGNGNLAVTSLKNIEYNFKIKFNYGQTVPGWGSIITFSDSDPSKAPWDAHKTFALLMSSGYNQLLKSTDTTANVEIGLDYSKAINDSNYHDIKIITSNTSDDFANNVRIYIDGTKIFDIVDDEITGTGGVSAFFLNQNAATYEIDVLDAPATFDYAVSQSDLISGLTENMDIASFSNGIHLANESTLEVINQIGSKVGTGSTVRFSFFGNTIDYIVLLKGDVNGDGHIAITDLVKIKQKILNVGVLNGIFETAGDIDADNVVSVNDLIAIKKHLLKVSIITQ